MGQTESYGAPAACPQSPVYTKREYLRVAADSEKSFEAQWETLPKTNPLVETMTHGMESGAETSIVKRTGGTWDIRGEPDTVRRLQSVTLPGFLINERLNQAAIERSVNRELQDERAFTP